MKCYPCDPLRLKLSIIPNLNFCLIKSPKTYHVETHGQGQHFISILLTTRTLTGSTPGLVLVVGWPCWWHDASSWWVSAIAHPLLSWPSLLLVCRSCLRVRTLSCHTLGCSWIGSLTFACFVTSVLSKRISGFWHGHQLRNRRTARQRNILWQDGKLLIDVMHLECRHFDTTLKVWNVD